LSTEAGAAGVAEPTLRGEAIELEPFVTGSFEIEEGGISRPCSCRASRAAFSLARLALSSTSSYTQILQLIYRALLLAGFGEEVIGHTKKTQLPQFRQDGFTGFFYCFFFLGGGGRYPEHQS